MNIKHELSDACPDSRRERILSLLEQSEGWCSGAYISDQFGISRAAIAKHIAALRSLGHSIEAAPRRGYRLAVKNDSLSKENMKGLLTTNTLGQKAWRYLTETTSTNKIAALWAVDGADEGCLVLAEHQVAGRGTKGNPWVTLPRGLQFSVVLRPSISHEITETLVMLGTVAVAEAISRLCPLSPVIKKPNDVLVNERKVCGVLVEVGLLGGDAAWAVLGIGCNVNAQRADFPTGLIPKASSLLVEGGVPISRRTLLAIILERIEKWYEEVQQGKADDLHAHWLRLQKKNS
ncbi:biotin--[acetyl-CoA-carboxylase] ligase [Desulfosarcina sp. OttesenSCG-928-G10]|nr:biotin--[acetyl-CoA-carboxylase] ligase [Desulfosarcina sp. OttesenSCG-928-G10]